MNIGSTDSGMWKLEIEIRVRNLTEDTIVAMTFQLELLKKIKDVENK